MDEFAGFPRRYGFDYLESNECLMGIVFLKKVVRILLTIQRVQIKYLFNVNGSTPQLLTTTLILRFF